MNQAQAHGQEVHHHIHMWQPRTLAEAAAGPQSSFPCSVADLRALIACMRELGVVQAFGVTLGPEPSKLSKLESEAKSASAERRQEIDQEIAQELREARIDAILADVADKLAATGREYSRAELLRFVPPEKLREIERLSA